MQIPDFYGKTKFDCCINITYEHKNVIFMKLSLINLTIFDKRLPVKFNYDQLSYERKFYE